MGLVYKYMNQHEKSNYQALKKIKQGKRIPLLRIIRLKSLECVCWQPSEVRKCPIPDCILYAYRMGKNPVPRKVSEVQKKQMIKNLRKARTNIHK